jgi:hypothetical protein
VSPGRRTQEKVRARKSFEAEDLLREEKSTTGLAGENPRRPDDREILEKLRGI